MAAQPSNLHDTLFTDRVLHSDNFKKAAQQFMETIAHSTSSHSFGLFISLPGKVQLVEFRGEKPTGILSSHILHDSSIKNQINLLKDSYGVSFPLEFNGSIFGALELFWEEEPSEEEVNTVKNICVQHAAHLVAGSDSMLEKFFLPKLGTEWRFLLENVPERMIILDRKGTILFINRTTPVHTVEEITGTAIYNYLSPQTQKEIKKNLESVFKSGNPSKYENIIRKADGSALWFEYSVAPIKHDGQVVAAIFIGVDVTERKQAEEALQESEERYRAVVEDQTELICRFVPDGELTFVNEAYCRYFGKNREDLVGTNFMLLIPEEDRYVAKMSLASLSPENPVNTVEHRVFAPEGEIHWQQWTDRAIFDDENRLVEIQSVGRDITKRKQAEEALRESEEKYRSLVEQSLQGIAIAQGSPPRIVFANNALAHMLGYTVEELLSLSIEGTRDLIHLEDRSAFFKRYRDRVRGKPAPTRYELRIVQKNGSVRWLEALANLIEYQGAPAVQAAFMDITERKQAEEQLKESEEKYRSIVELAPDGIVTVNLKGVVTSVNTAYKTMTGYTTDEVVGKHFANLPTALATDIPQYIKLFTSLLRGKIPDPFTFSWRHKDGTIRLGEAHVSFIKKGGKIVGLQAVTRDITERKKTEEALQSERDKLKALFEGLDRTGIGIDIVGIDHRVQIQNEALRKQFGDLTGKLCYKEYIGLEEPCENCPMIKAIKENRVESTEIFNIHGRHIELISAPLPNPDGTIDKAIEVAIDNTERIKAEKALRESEEKFRSLFEESRDAICITSEEGIFLDVNQSALDLFGYTREEMVGLELSTLYVNRADHSAFLKEITQKHSVKDYEVHMQRKDGTVIHCLVTSVIWQDHEGTFLGYQSIFHDITERKKMEDKIRNYAKDLEKKITERTKELIRANQLKSEFLANMSHEFRTPLNSILSFADLLLLGLDGPVNAQQKQDLQMIKESGEDLLALVNNLLDLSKIEAGKVELHMEPLDPTEVIAVVTSQLTIRAMEDGLSLTTHIARDLPFVLADENKLRQILRNLLENALKFTKEGEVSIGARSENGDVVFWVKDTGVGIAEEDQEVIFDKFRQARRGTTEGSGGAGLGLSVAKELVELHNGRIWVESDAGKGSTFYFTVPVAP